jgi:hypothetical protein
MTPARHSMVLYQSHRFRFGAADAMAMPGKGLSSRCRHLKKTVGLINKIFRVRRWSHEPIVNKKKDLERYKNDHGLIRTRIRCIYVPFREDFVETCATYDPRDHGKLYKKAEVEENYE